jgi:hypothetical protein
VDFYYQLEFPRKRVPPPEDSALPPEQFVQVGNKRYPIGEITADIEETMTDAEHHAFWELYNSNYKTL